MCSCCNAQMSCETDWECARALLVAPMPPRLHVRGLLIKDFRQKAMSLAEARWQLKPTNEGFADLSLPTWVPRLGRTV